MQLSHNPLGLNDDQQHRMADFHLVHRHRPPVTFPARLAQTVELTAGQSRQVTITADPRLLARFDGPDGVTGCWRIAEGTYRMRGRQVALRPQG